MLTERFTLDLKHCFTDLNSFFGYLPCFLQIVKMCVCTCFEIILNNSNSSRGELLHKR